MKKNIAIASLSILTIAGSILAFLSGNYLLSDIGNFNGFPLKSTILTSFPIVFFTAAIVVIVLYVLRLYQRPNTFKKLTKLYSIILLVLGSLGLITDLLCGFITYRSFTSPYPFSGYLIVFMILNILLICGAVISLIFLRKCPEDQETFKVDAKHVFKTIGWFMFIGLVFNRLGAFLFIPTYIYLRNLHLTFTFYLYLLMPLYFGIIKVLNILGIGLNGKKSIILPIIGLSFDVLLFLSIVIIGMNNTGMISSVSPTMPIERIASLPLEIILHFVSITSVGVILLVNAIRKQNKNN
ncbi:MAG: hypothetical protein J6M95_03730 [Bacilli bacterium]|nr:hypothetical protein [Bacilli bacterium]